MQSAKLRLWETAKKNQSYFFNKTLQGVGWEKERETGRTYKVEETYEYIND